MLVNKKKVESVFCVIIFFNIVSLIRVGPKCKDNLVGIGEIY